MKTQNKVCAECGYISYDGEECMKHELTRTQIIDWLENQAHFRDYRFKSARFFGKTSIRSSVNILNPTQSDLEDAVNTFSRDGFSQIIIYLKQSKQK